MDEVPQSGRENGDQNVQIEKEGSPSRRLMLGDGGNDGNVDARVSRVPEGIETTRPRSNHTRRSQKDDRRHAHAQRQTNQQPEELGHALLAQLVAQVAKKGDHLDETENAKRRHVLTWDITRFKSQSNQSKNLVLIGWNPTKGTFIAQSCPTA